MNPFVTVEDIIVDTIAEKLIPDAGLNISLAEQGSFFGRGTGVSYKKETYERVLITESMVRKVIREGSLTMKIPDRALITPAARLLMDEKGIGLTYGR